MGIFDDLEDWTAKNIFANTDIGPAEIVEFIPKGDWSKIKKVSAVVVRDHFQGSNEVRGDGIAMEKPSGRTERNSIVVEFLECVDVAETQDRAKPDLIRLNNKAIYSAVRTLGEDDGMRGVLFVNVKDLFRRQQTPR